MFPGINPFLNTHLKRRHVWPDFHTTHISDIKNALRAALAPKGYEVYAEQGVQIRGDAGGAARARPDVAIVDPENHPRGGLRPQASKAPEVRGVVEVMPLDPDVEYPAIKIYDAASNLPLAWIELLSPANKPPSSHFTAYDAKRTQVVQLGIVFVEIDYIQWLAPTWPNTPAYARDHSDAAPYRITVIDPHPTPLEGTAYGYPFGVLDAVPEVAIPLRENDWFEFDFGAPYRKTFTESLYDQIIGDALDGYHAADAEKIRAFVAG